MQVSSANDIKIYNLSHGKSIPEWLSSKQRRELTKKNIDVRRRIQLIQHFEMPDVAHCLYIFAAGSYKPFLKCFDVEQMSEKFARGIDEDIMKIVNLTDDYSKQQRWLELHYSRGRYFRLRIPKFGRDMGFVTERSELVVTASGDELYRLNLEQGEFLEPYRLQAGSGTALEVAEWHQLITAGTTEGIVECWDHRDKNRVGLYDVMPAISRYAPGLQAVTALKFKDPIYFGVGTSSGHVVLCDLRTTRPLLVKDLKNELPVRRIEFVNYEKDTVLSMDSRALKIWDEQTGKAVTAIEPDVQTNDFVRYPDSGLIFIAAETPKMLQYLIPFLGPAPKWCSFLESITEELEESSAPTVYDDYKFVTETELEEVGLKHLIGTPMLRAYMHGFFIDLRLYRKAKTQTQPFAFENYKKRKIRDALESEREKSAVAIKPQKPQLKVNKELAQRLEQEAKAEAKQKKNHKEKAEVAATLLADSRFAQLFDNIDFQVDEDSETFKRTAAKLEKAKKTKQQDDDVESEVSTSGDDHGEEDDTPLVQYDHNEDAKQRDVDEVDELFEESEEETEEEDEVERLKAEKKAARKQRQLKKQQRQKVALEAERKAMLASKPKEFTLYELETGEGTQRFVEGDTQTHAEPLSQRRSKLEESNSLVKVEQTPFGGSSYTFVMQKQGKAAVEEGTKLKAKQHQQERKEVRRAATKLSRSLDRRDAARRGARR